MLTAVCGVLVGLNAVLLWAGYRFWLWAHACGETSSVVRFGKTTELQAVYRILKGKRV